MRVFKFLLCYLILLASCISNQTKSKAFGNKEVLLAENVKIVIPISEERFSDTLLYNHIEIWINSKKVYTDQSKTEYLFDSKEWPTVQKLKSGEYQVVLKVFDAPDYNKLWVFTFKENKLIKKDVIPFFDAPITDYNGDGKVEYAGILHVIDSPENADSCYYNPTLYYRFTDLGLKIDSTTTIEMNKKKWGKFYGFKQSDKIVLNCK